MVQLFCFVFFVFEFRKYDEPEHERSAIMQDIRDNEKKQLAAILNFVSAKFVMDYPCVRPCILFYIHSPAILHFFRVT